jgi:hypothetical protein
VQLARIQLRVPEYGWTTQKVFHLLNFLCAGGAWRGAGSALCARNGADEAGRAPRACCAVRCGVFACRQEVDTLQPAVWRHVLLDLPGLLFFSTYTLLVLFWAEIYHQARAHAARLRRRDSRHLGKRACALSGGHRAALTRP